MSDWSRAATVFLNCSAVFASASRACFSARRVTSNCPASSRRAVCATASAMLTPVTPPMVARMASASRDATAGRRLAHFSSRTHGVTGRAWIGFPSRNRRSSSARVAAEAYRRPGSFSRHFRQIVSRSRGTDGIEPPRRHRLLADHLDHRVHRRRRLERRPAGQQRVECRPQRVDIRRRADLAPIPPGLLGRHVAGRAHDLARAGQPAIRLRASWPARSR